VGTSEAPTCQRCRRPIVGRGPRAVYCSPECRSLTFQERRAIRTREAQRKEGRKLGAYFRECEACRERFRPTRPDAEYCSPKCKQAAWRSRTGFRAAWEAREAREKAILAKPIEDVTEAEAAFVGVDWDELQALVSRLPRQTRYSEDDR
jgi:hypothetical protein